MRILSFLLKDVKYQHTDYFCFISLLIEFISSLKWDDNKMENNKIGLLLLKIFSAVSLIGAIVAVAVFFATKDPGKNERYQKTF